MKKLYSLLFLLLSAAAVSQNNFKTADSILATFNKPGSPGISIQVVKDGKVLYSKQAGMADIENKKPLTKESVFHMASDSKQFVAACVVLLQQKGKLNFDDKLSKYFPDFPEYTQNITIAHLMNHTSGIKDIGVLAMLRGENDNDYNDAQVRALLKNAALDFEPGVKWSYSNSGYWFLAQIVKQVSGMPMIKFVDVSIFKPLKMKHSLFVDSRDVQFANKVKGYEILNGKFSQTIIDPYHIGGAGLYAPVGDLQKWLNEMMGQKVLGKAFWNEMLKVTSKNGYAAGLFITDFEGHRKISHGGDNEGFHSVMGVYPDDKLNVIVIANNNEAAPKDIEESIAANVFGITNEETENDENQVAEKINVSTEILKQYKGIYGSGGSNFYIQPIDNGLWLMQIHNDVDYSLEPLTRDSFTYSGLVFAFEDINNGVAQTLAIDQGGKKDKFTRITLDPKLMSEYSGTYFCKSLDVKYIFFEEDAMLKFKIASDDVQETVIVTGDKLYSDMGTIKLKRDTSGKITGFILNHSRAKNLEFVKV